MRDGAHHVAAELFQGLNDVGVHDLGRWHDVLGWRGDAQN
jgi:hypothetical protein